MFLPLIPEFAVRIGTHTYLLIILCLAPFVNHPPQNLSHKYKKSGRCLLLVNQIILKTRQVLIRKNQPATVQPAPVIDEAVVDCRKHIDIQLWIL